MSENPIVKGALEALAFAKGDKSAGKLTTVEVPNRVDVKEVRKKLQMTQQEFSSRFGFKLGTLKNWEQGLRQPEGPARAFLVVISKAPETVMEALS